MISLISRSSRAARISLAIGLAAAGFAGQAAVQADSAEAAGFSCWVQGAYLNDSGGFGHRAVCTEPSIATVTLKRDGIVVSQYISTMNVSPAPANFVSTGFQGFARTCRARYQTVVHAVRYGGGAAMYWTSGVPRAVC